MSDHRDRLSALLQRFGLRARVVSAGPLVDEVRFDATPGAGHLHFLREGTLGVRYEKHKRVRVEEPSVLFFPRPGSHRLDAPHSAELVSTEIEFGVGDENPLLRALPSQICLPLARVSGLELTQQLLFAEALRHRCGGEAVVSRLAEIGMVQVLRHAIEHRLVEGGLVAGLADPRLHRAISAVHAEPARTWTLASMAAEAGMSRARFAAHFLRCVGVPPGEYLTGWRMGLARRLLRQGLAVKHVAAEVGYANASALGRVFSQRVGSSPTAWQLIDRAARH